MSRLLVGAIVAKVNVIRGLGVPSNCQKLWKSIGMVYRMNHTSVPSYAAATHTDHLKRLDHLSQDIMTAPSSQFTGISIFNHADELCQTYMNCDEESKRAFLLTLSSKYLIDKNKVSMVTQAFFKSQREIDTDSIQEIERLRQTLTPAYNRIFSIIGKLDYGVKFLVDMRRDILRLESSAGFSSGEMPQKSLKVMNGHLRNQLSHWFSTGILNLQRITWDSSCLLLEKISKYEAVHPLENWGDLKRRVGANRRCYILTHSCLPNEPVVIIHVALLKDISDNIQEILNESMGTDDDGKVSSSLSSSKKEHSVEEKLEDVDAATFYSISSPQKGLQGIELGTQMIREVVRRISFENPGISMYSSLSPIPGFRDHLLSQIQSVIRGDAQTVPNFINSHEVMQLQKMMLDDVTHGDAVNNLSIREKEGNELWHFLIEVLRSNSWVNDAKLRNILRQALMRKCAHYLHSEKRNGYALNSVAHFHLKNGSVMWRLNWMADSSPRGLSNSCGMMVNYRYFADSVDINSHKYLEEKYITTSEIFQPFLESS